MIHRNFDFKATVSPVCPIFGGVFVFIFEYSEAPSKH